MDKQTTGSKIKKCVKCAGFMSIFNLFSLCQKCSAEQNSQGHCPSCGSERKEGHKFCVQCHYRIHNIKCTCCGEKPASQEGVLCVECHKKCLCVQCHSKLALMNCAFCEDCRKVYKICNTCETEVIYKTKFMCDHCIESQTCISCGRLPQDETERAKRICGICRVTKKITTCSSCGKVCDIMIAQHNNGHCSDCR